MTTANPNASGALPVGNQYKRSTGLWGMWTLIGTEASLFAYLLFSYFYVASQHAGRWPPSGEPELVKSSINTVLLLLSSGCAWWGERGARHGRRGAQMLGLVGALVLGSIFMGIQFSEWHNRPYSLSTDAYSSLYFTITGFHMMHVAVGLLVLAALLVWAALGYFDARRHTAFSVGVLYWHFVDVVWLAVYASLFISPHLA